MLKLKIITQDWDGLIPGLLAGRIDLFLADSVVASESFLKKPEGKDYSFVGPDLTDSRWFGEGVGIAWRKEDTGLLKKLNEAIEKIRADGLIRKSRINILRATKS